MNSLTRIFKKVSFAAAVTVLSSFTLFSSAGVAFAADTAPCTAPPDSSYGTGVHHPVGTDAAMYTFNCAKGLWVSAYYTYNPATSLTSPTYAPNYSYDCARGVWTMDDWYFSPTDGSYHLSRVTVSDPGLATGCPVAATPTGAGNTGTTPDATTPAGTGGTSIAGTGTGSVNGVASTIALGGTTTNTTGINIGNGLTSNANTGNTFVVGNTTGGSAASGNAQSIANVANLLQSTSNTFGPGTTVFTANINGDVTGDFMFDPSAILATGPGSTNTAANNLTVNTNDTNNTTAQINNNIDVGATSGNATVASNTTAGDATSGNAQAVVNLMNLINSTVAAGNSFIGTININGDLNGDILLPQGVLDQLLASSGPGSNNLATTNLTDNSTTTNHTTETVANNINSSANTGNASVVGNTKAGSATSGTAGSNVTLLNLTGSNVIGKNDLLVFVNVLGKWVGMIMNAPAGSSAAELGGSVSNSGPSSSNTLANSITDNSNMTNNATLGITNNVNVHAKSGNATVANNTVGGNANTGNANTAVNVLNLMGSNLSLSNWFGVLFINVFGIWNGSFGVNTSAGDPITVAAVDNPVQASTQASIVNSFKQLASFVAKGSGSSTGSSSDVSNSQVLGTTTSVAKKISADATQLPSADNAPHASFLLPIIGVVLASTILLVSERGRFFSRKHL